MNLHLDHHMALVQEELGLQMNFAKFPQTEFRSRELQQRSIRIANLSKQSYGSYESFPSDFIELVKSSITHWNQPQRLILKPTPQVRRLVLSPSLFLV
jgi:hypothetical protein